MKETKDIEKEENIVMPSKGLKEKFLEESRLKILIIGVGNAGGQAAVQAHNSEFNTFIINSSVKDLKTEVVSDEIKSFVIGNGRGCGKDRLISKEFLKRDFETLLKTKDFVTMIDNSDIVILVTSTAGGTGSGVTPLLAYLLGSKYPSKTFLIFGFLPKESESSIAQYNTIEFVDELDKLKIPYSLLDSRCMEAEDTKKVHNSLCTEFVDKVKVIRGDYFYESTDDMIDESDELSIITKPGLFNISIKHGVTQEQFGSLSKIMIKNLGDDSMNCPLQKDKKIACMGVVINTPDGTSETIKTGNYKELSDVVGNALKVYSHFGITDKPESQLITILSGLTLPYDRIKICKKLVEAASVAETKVKIDLSEDKSSLAFMKSDELSRSKILGTNKGTKDTKEILNEIPDFF